MAASEQIEKRIQGLENFKEIVGKFVAALGDPSQYEFRGEVIDLGEYGAGKCTCGHIVRYLLLIWGPNGNVAPIGCECVKHFQSYNEKLYNSLENARLGLYEALAAEERERAEVLRLAKRDEVQPLFELAKTRFLAVCRMHREHINKYLPYVMWQFESTLKKAPEYKKTSSYIRFYETKIVEIDKILGQYERGELK